MMVNLTGEFREEAQEVLNDLHLGIDAGKKIATSTHDFELKLLAIDNLIMHINFKYGEHEDLNEFFMEISDTIVELREELEALKKGTIHIILEEEAAQQRGISWMLKHRKIVRNKIKAETNIDKVIIKKIHYAFKQLTKKFSQVEHLFLVDIKKATVKEIKLDLEESEEEVKHILERLMSFFVAYETIFRQELVRLEK